MSETYEDDQESDPGESSSSSPMLYDVLVYREWPPQPVDQNPQGEFPLPVEESLMARLASWARWSGGINTNSLLPPRVSLLFGSRSPWKISLTDDGSMLAVLEDNQLEIYQRDHYQAPLAKIRINKDPLPTYRHLCWSPDGSLLAATTSNGQVDIFDSFGFLVYPVFSQKLPARDAQHNVGNSYAGIFFSTIRVKSRDWIFELILVDFQGRINSFLLSPSGYQEFTSFNLASHHQGSITAVTLCPDRGLLCIVGQGSFGESSGPSGYGLSMWRLLGEPPYYDFVAPYDHNVSGSSPSRFFVTNYFYPVVGKHQDHVYLMEVSPNGKNLCCVHASGNISVWQIPSLRPNVFLPLEDQPAYDDLSPSLLQNPKFKKKKRQFLKNDLKWLPLSVKWWNDESLVVVRFSGGVSIIAIQQNENLLGDSAEFFAGAPTLTQSYAGGFFLLECDTTTSKKVLDPDISDQAMEEDQNFPSESESSSDDEDFTVLQRGKRMATSLAYTLTESDRFAPPRKKPKLLVNTYKLISLTSTTPEELYARKIEMEEYGEALILAQHYDLDSDQVYERQWKLSNLSVTAIKDYLTKIKRRSLVLRECTTTVPSDVDAVRELLEYGLKETDSDVIGSEGDELARFIADKGFVPEPTYLSEDELKREAKEKEERALSKVNWQNLTVYQRDILTQRRLLIKYLNRLEGFISVVEEEAYFNKIRDVEPFDPELYIKFRDQPVLKSTIEFAREGRIGAVSALLHLYPIQLNKYILGILGNIPESVSPDLYSHLIPWKPSNLPRQAKPDSGQRDWSDYHFVRKTLVKDPAADDEGEVNRVVRTLDRRYILDNGLSLDLLSDWINERSRNIYEESAIVDHSLALLYCAEVNAINIDPWLQHRFLIIESIWRADSDDIISLKSIEKMSHLQVAVKLMEGCISSNHLMTNFNKNLGPFLDRLDTIEPGTKQSLLRNYLLNLSAISLEVPTMFLKECFVDGSTPSNFDSNDEWVSMGIECIYSYDGEEDQENLVIDLAGFLRKKSVNPVLREELSDILDIMRSIKLGKKYGIVKSLHFFKSSRNNSKVMEDLCVQITRRAEGKKPRFNSREWSEVLQDLFELRRLCPLIISEWFCVETICNSLLCSESKENIKLVQDIFGHTVADILFKTSTKSSPMLYILSMYKVGQVPINTQKRAIIAACQFYFDSCRDVNDPNLEFVKLCLNLLPQSERTDPELVPVVNFLSALEMLHEFGVSILPIILRNSENQLNVVRKILQANDQAYKNVRKIIKLVKLLGSIGSVAKEDEASILSLVADFALKASDFEASLTICEILMSSHPTSKASCKVCKELVEQDAFENLEAKSRLSAFCVTYCSEEEIEEMLRKRKEIFGMSLSDESIEGATPEFGGLDDFASQPAAVALVKAAAETTSRALPESGTRAISKLWGKLSQFTPGLQNATSDNRETEPELPRTRTLVESEIIPSGKLHLYLFVDPFYERCFTGCKIGKLQACFESYAVYRQDGSMDEATLKLLRHHYENSFGQMQQCEDELDWPVLKDILVNLVATEDCALGLSLMLSELRHREPIVTQELLEDSRMAPYILYLVSIFELLGKLGRKTFQVSPGLAYASVKALRSTNRLNSELFDSATLIADVDQNID